MNIKFHERQSSVSQVCPFGWKERSLKNLTRIADTLHEELNTFSIISLSVLLRMRNVSDKIVKKI